MNDRPDPTIRSHNQTELTDHQIPPSDARSHRREALKKWGIQMGDSTRYPQWVKLNWLSSTQLAKQHNGLWVMGYGLWVVGYGLNG